jgi:hypothetical protein
MKYHNEIIMKYRNEIAQLVIVTGNPGVFLIRFGCSRARFVGGRFSSLYLHMHLPLPLPLPMTHMGLKTLDNPYAQQYL